MKDVDIDRIDMSRKERRRKHLQKRFERKEEARDVLRQVRGCRHAHPATKMVGRKKKSKMTFCMDCGLVLELE